MQTATTVNHRLETVHRHIGKKMNNKICIKTAQGIYLIKIDEIVRIEADKSYCTMYFSGVESLVVSKSLKQVADTLPAHSFVRIHASHLVNIDFIKKYMLEDGGHVVLNNGLQVPVARRRKQQFLKFLKEHVMAWTVVN